MSAEPPATRRRIRDSEQRDPEDVDYLDSVEDGCGCTEIWEHLSEKRASDD